MASIITSVFETSRGNYDRLYKVFEYSALKHMPQAEIICLREVNMQKRRNNTYSAMTARLDQWADIAGKVKGDIIFADADIVFTGDMFKVFDKFDFDIAYTKRKHRKRPINGGIVFVRDGSQAFIELWARVNRKMYLKPKLHAVWKKKCSGMNQPSFWYLLKHPEKHPYKMLGLPCQIYNACENEWGKINADIQAVHLKRTLRRVVEGKDRMRPEYQKAIQIWKQYEREATCEK
jgi:hypothetical protein